MSTVVGNLVRVGVQPGPGLVARFGAAALLIGAERVDQGAFVPAALELLDRWSQDTAPAGYLLVWRMARLVAGLPEGAPPFGLVASDGPHHFLMLRGAVSAVVEAATDPEHRTELTGAWAVTWLDHVVPDPVAAISLSLLTGPVVPETDLDGGVVAGTGLRLVTGPPAPAPPGMPPPPAADAPPPTATDGLPVPPVPPAGEQTAFVAPTALALVADDGARILLDRSYVFGRDPYSDPAVQAGNASPVVVRDPDQMISRVQVSVTVSDGAVVLHDRGSANGTFIAAPGAAEWARLDNQPALLPPGWSMRIGRRIYTYAVSSPPLD